MDPALKDKVTEKLKALEAIEQVIPAVFIVHSFPQLTVEYMSQRGLGILGITLEEVRNMKAEYYSRFFNPDDAADYVPKMRGLLSRNDSNEMITFFQEVRPSPEQPWSLYLSSTKIFMRDDEGNPLLTLTLAVPIDSTNHITAKVQRLLEENDFLRRQHHRFACLTKREKQILALIASGLNSAEISDRLHISENTTSTHRKNIKSKLNLQNNYDITRFAQAFDLI